MHSDFRPFGPTRPIPLAPEGQSHSLAPEGQSITDSNPYIIKTDSNPRLRAKRGKPSHRHQARPARVERRGGLDVYWGKDMKTTHNEEVES